MSRKNGWIGVASPFNAPLYPTPHRLLRFPREIVTWNMDMFSSEVFTLSKAKEPSRTCQKSSALTCHLGFCICACTQQQQSLQKSHLFCLFLHKKNRLKVNAVFWCGVDFHFETHYHHIIIAFWHSWVWNFGMRQKINLHYKNVYWQRSMTSS